MDSLADETIDEICSHLDRKTLVPLCILNKAFAKACYDDIRLIITRQDLKSAIEDRDVVSIIRSLDAGSYLNTWPHWYPNALVKWAFRYRMWGIIKRILPQLTIVELALISAGRTGSLKWVKEVRAMLPAQHQATAYDYCFEGASREGHLRLIKDLLDLGVTNYDDGLVAASRGGQLKVVKMMMALGAFSVNDALDAACRGGHREIYQFMTKKGARPREISLDNACLSGNCELVVEVHSSTVGANIRRPLTRACIKNNREVFDYLRDKGANIRRQAYYEMCGRGHLELLKRITPLSHHWMQTALIKACSNGQIEVIRYLINSASYDLNPGLLVASCYGLIKVVRLLVEHGANLFQEALESCLSAKYSNPEVIKYLTQLISQN